LAAIGFKGQIFGADKDTVEHPKNGHDDHANVVCGVFALLAPPPFEEPSITATPIAGYTPRGTVPGGSYFGGSGGDGGGGVFIPPTIGQLTAPASPAPSEPAKPAAPRGESWTGPHDGCPPWLRKTPPVEKRVAEPIRMKSGDETRAQQDRVNADRSLEYKIMGPPKYPW